MLTSLGCGRTACLDWNWIRTAPKAQFELPKSWAFVLPDIALAEAADTTADGVRNPDGIRAKYHSLYLRFGQQIYVPNNPTAVILRERPWSPRIRTPLSKLIDVRQSLKWARHLARSSRQDFVDGAAQIRKELKIPSTSVSSVQAAKDRFAAFRTEFRNTGRSHNKTTAKQIENDKGSKTLIDFVRTPSAIIEYIRFRFPRCAREHSLRNYSQFPDPSALCRLARIELWYVLKGLAADPASHGNDFEDLTYAFMASYCGTLVTSDVALREACMAVFPHVRVVKTPQDV